MATHVSSRHFGDTRKWDEPVGRVRPASFEYVVPIARTLFAAIFLLSIPHLFSAKSVQFANQHGVPVAVLAVPVAGVIALLGGLSVWLGLKARVGAWLLVVFLLPVTFWMHDFWNVTDSTLAQMDQINFMKNLSLMGGALLIAYFGAGPFSIDSVWRKRGFAR
jgi:putative oxidoreductase